MSFNGAMTFRSWRDVNLTQAVTTDLTLQWGHDLSVMERGWSPLCMKRIRKLQWGHDLSVMESWRTSSAVSVSQWLQWGHDLSVMESS